MLKASLILKIVFIYELLFFKIYDLLLLTNFYLNILKIMLDVL